MAYQPKSYRKFVATAATATLVASAFAPFASAATDVPADSRYAGAVDFLASKGVTGFSDGTFKPHQNITRTDAAVMLVNVLGLDIEAAPASGFTDVPPRATKHVNALKAAGITSGAGNGKFNAHAQITRGELAIWINNAFKLEGSAYVNFSDVSERYYEAVSKLVANQITNGRTATTFGTNQNATRGDYAIFLQRAFQASDVGVVASVKAINATTVEVTYKDAVTVDDINASKYTIDGLEVKNASIKQTDSKTVVLTTATQDGTKTYTVKKNGTTVGTFKGVSAVIPTKVDVTTSSIQGIIGQEVTLKAAVTVAEGQSKDGIPVTFNVVNTSGNVNDKIEVVAYTNAEGVATYSYTRYYASEDNVTAYATSKSSVYSSAKVYWANKIQLAVTEITAGNELANETKKSYKVTGKANSTYYIAIKENLGVAPDKITDVKVQNHGSQSFTTPYELTTGATSFATVTTNASGEGAFTIYGSNLSATPIVYAPESTPTTPVSFKYDKLDLQAVAPTVKFSQVDRLAVAVVGEGTADSAEYFGTTAPVKYNANSAGGRTYTVTVTDKAGKIAPEGTVAYVAFSDLAGDVYFTTATADFVKVSKNDIKQIVVGKEGKAQFRVAGKGATTYVKPTVFLNTAGDVNPVKLDKADVQVVADTTYFKSAVVTNATLAVTDKLGRTITSTTAGEDAFFTYQSVDQNGFAYRPVTTYASPTGATTQMEVWKQVTLADGTIGFVKEIVTVPGTVQSNQYVLAFDVTSTFGNAIVKDAQGVALPVHQNLGSTKTYQVKADAEGKAIVRITSTATDVVSVNVSGASNILPTQTASVSFTNAAAVPNIYTGVVESINTTNQTLKFVGKNAISYVGTNVVYKGLNNTPLATATDFENALLTATGAVQVTYEVKDSVTTFYIYSITSGVGTPPANPAGLVAAKAELQEAINAVVVADYTTADQAAVLAAKTAAQTTHDTATIVADVDAAKAALASALVGKVKKAKLTQTEVDGLTITATAVSNFNDADLTISFPAGTTATLDVATIQITGAAAGTTATVSGNMIKVAGKTLAEVQTSTIKVNATLSQQDKLATNVTLTLTYDSSTGAWTVAKAVQ